MVLDTLTFFLSSFELQNLYFGIKVDLFSFNRFCMGVPSQLQTLTINRGFL